MGDMPAQTRKVNLMRKVNFGAGPAALPESVLRDFAADLVDFEGSGVGIGELSHRTELFEGGVLGVANTNLLKLTGYDASKWRVMWMTGGGTGQFAAVPLNFDFTGERKAVYLVTGTWSEKAAEEAKKIVGAERIVVIDLRVKELSGVLGLKEPQEWITSDLFVNVNYVYYCDNETVDGLELPHPDYFEDLLSDHLDDNVVFVVDASSNFLSRPLPREGGKTGVVFAGVQKNLGAAGVTVVLIKEGLLEKISPRSYW
jgi:phosphoserine aminotransferase